MAATLCRQLFLFLGIVFALVEGASATKCVILAPGLDDAETKLLADAFSSREPGDVQVVESLSDALGSDADLVVLFVERESMPTMDEKALDSLRQRKVIGIGYGAAQMFGKLGLEIHGGACAHNPLAREPAIDFQANEHCPSLAGKTLVAFRVPEAEIPDERMATDYNFAMHLPRLDARTKFVEAIARWRGDGNYAPVVRQGSFVMIGLAAPPSTWTEEYRAFLAELGTALAGAPKEPFSRAQYEITPPGEYEFELARGRSTTELSRRTFYFRFGAPTEFSATLTSEDSNAVMMLFRGENGEHHTRKDGGANDTLAIEAEIFERALRSVGDGYWTLDVTNFDRSNRATCKVRIEY